MTVRRFRVEKLIRDRLPELMRAQGLSVFERRMETGEFIARLKEKLIEEAREAAASESRGELVEELADLTEVVAALADAAGILPAEIETVRLKKRAERGGFDDRIFNAAVEAPDGAPAIDYYLARPLQYPEVP
jgi:predicted house-cleaning noncanonical NTP pyrophosphatase (MazG superfamily)